jgi:DNA-binding GntR family transcriptional regulator
VAIPYSEFKEKRIMKALSVGPSLTEQVYQAIVEEVLSGRLVQGEHLVQELLAAKLGVSRQPIQQAMALLKADGMVEEIGKRGLRVAGLDHDRIRGHYDIREMLDGYAARSAARAIASGKPVPKGFRAQVDDLFDKGAKAIDAQDVREQIRCDEDLHKLIYHMSGNPVLQEMAEPNWRFLRRVMAEVLRLAEPVSTIWEQHRLIIDAVMDGEEDIAAKYAQDHVRNAATRLMAALTRHGVGATTSAPDA